MLGPDIHLVQEWIEPGSRVLDLGCGDGELLFHLKREQGIQECGLEINPDHLNHCLRLGLNVIEQDMDKGLENFETGSFDTVVLAHTLQAVHHPDKLVDEMLRIGRRCIVTFPNFAYWRYRLYLLSRGRMPVARTLPYQWYDTPNIHFCTIRDFDVLCQEKGIRVLNRLVADFDYRQGPLMHLWPNLLGINAIYHISR